MSSIPYTHDGYEVSRQLPAGNSKSTNQYYNSSSIFNKRADEDSQRLCDADPDCPWSFICIDGTAGRSAGLLLSAAQGGVGSYHFGHLQFGDATYGPEMMEEEELLRFALVSFMVLCVIHEF
ncbi:uncharacterized protein N7503_007522 [Penicillium pulvis]|uniref:uncharacterized protein n=1 Tax=Penicillium pulvis TaxID=1562058 RepID=UPI0025497BBE|nr:uncharacterized protein N7503_007522 [Penicillium pulvis]KAJ5798226.1 hypothetical protein N7503_007522 [Penicillium pulvis]